MPSGFMESWAYVKNQRRHATVVESAGSSLLSISMDIRLILILDGKDLRYMMKVGDVVKLRSNGKIGLVIDRFTRSEPDGNPNGDFMVCYRYRVLFGEETMIIQNGVSVEVISESR